MRNKASLVLMEQAVIVLVFALVAALCLGCFAWADHSARENARLDKAMATAQNAAEVTRYYRGNPEAIAKLLGGSCLENTVTVPWAQEDGSYLQIVLMPREGLLGRAYIEVKARDGQVLAQLEIAWQEELP